MVLKTHNCQINFRVYLIIFFLFYQNFKAQTAIKSGKNLLTKFGMDTKTEVIFNSSIFLG